jgi:hypothetical protein
LSEDDPKMDSNLDPSSDRFVVSAKMKNSFGQLKSIVKGLVGSLESFKRTQNKLFRKEIEKALEKVKIVLLSKFFPDLII